MVLAQFDIPTQGVWVVIAVCLTFFGILEWCRRQHKKEKDASFVGTFWIVVFQILYGWVAIRGICSLFGVEAYDGIVWLLSWVLPRN